MKSADYCNADIKKAYMANRFNKLKIDENYGVRTRNFEQSVEVDKFDDEDDDIIHASLQRFDDLVYSLNVE